MFANQEQTIREGSLRLFIPSGGQHRDFAVRMQPPHKQRDQRKQRKQARGGTRNGQLVPLALRLHPQMFTRFFKGHLDRPAHHYPLEYLFGRGVEFGRGEKTVRQLAFRVAGDDVANLDRRFAFGLPQRSLRIDEHFLLLPAVPIQLFLFPYRIGMRGALGGREAPRAFEWLGARFACHLRASLIIEHRIATHTKDQDQIRRARANQGQLDRGVTTIDNQDKQSFRQPTMDEPDQGHQNIDGRLVLTRGGFGQGRSRLFLRPIPGFALLLLARFASVMAPDFRPLSVLLGATQHSQKRQGPDSLRPRQARQNHQREPLQAETFDDVLATGSDRVAVTPPTLDLPGAPPLKRIVAADDDRALSGQRQDNQSEENLAGLQRVPFGAIEHPMVVLKMPLIAQADHTQTCGDRAFATSQQRPKQQHLGVFPSGFGKQWLKDYNQAQQFGRQCSHPEDLSWRKFLPKFTLPAVTFSKSKNGQSGEQQYRYDCANRLVQVSDASGNVLATYAYGAGNQRLMSVEGGVVKYFAWDGGKIIAEYEAFGTNGLIWKTSYVYLGERLLATTSGAD